MIICIELVSVGKNNADFTVLNLNGGIFDFCLCVLDNDIVCLFSLNNLCIAVFVCTVCTCRGNNRNALTVCKVFCFRSVLCNYGNRYAVYSFSVLVCNSDNNSVIGSDTLFIRELNRNAAVVYINTDDCAVYSAVIVIYRYLIRIIGSNNLASIIGIYGRLRLFRFARLLCRVRLFCF